MPNFKTFSTTQSAADRTISRKPVPMQLGNDEATRRLVLNTAKRVIKTHRVELEELAHK